MEKCDSIRNDELIKMAWSKRMSAPLANGRKSEGKFIVSARGPHAKGASISALSFLREYMGFAETFKEGKNAIKRGELTVDGRACRDEKFGLGMMDTAGVPSSSAFFRVLAGRNGLKLLKISDKDSKIKVCKIIGKKTVKGGKTQYNLHDGRNMISAEKYNTRDSLVISLPEQKVVEHLKFEEGSVCLITTGKNAGTAAKLEKIDGRMKRVWMKKEGGRDFEAPLDYVMIVGKEKPAIAVE